MDNPNWRLKQLDRLKKPKKGESSIPFEIEAILHPTPPPDPNVELLKVINEYESAERRFKELREGMSALRYSITLDYAARDIQRRRRIRRRIVEYIKNKYSNECFSAAIRYVSD